jgi:hypothetical protein
LLVVSVILITDFGLTSDDTTATYRDGTNDSSITSRTRERSFNDYSEPLGRSRATQRSQPATFPPSGPWPQGMSRLSRTRDSPHKTSQSDSSTQWLLVVLATLISVFLYALDNTVVADIVPAIFNDFGRVTELP